MGKRQYRFMLHFAYKNNAENLHSVVFFDTGKLVNKRKYNFYVIRFLIFSLKLPLILENN